MKIGILVSGDGSELDDIHRAGVKPVLVLADRPCTALHKAQGYHLRRELVQCSDFSPAFDKYREVYTRRVISVLMMYGVELVILAGYKTVLSPVFVERYPGRVINARDYLVKLKTLTPAY